MRVKHYFAAGSTAKGFINYFNYINDAAKDGFLYILKGGPGTGKSTLMKKIGAYFEGRGFYPEYFHCASDPESLDGVRIPELNAAVVDGTAPHVTEAKIAGVTDAIINLGEFIGAGVREHKDEIIPLLEQKKRCFALAETYLRAAGELFGAEIMELGKMPSACDAAANVRKLFMTSPECSALSALNQYRETITVGDSYAEGVLMLREKAAELGGGITVFSSVLSPDYPEAIEAGDTLFTAHVSLNDMTKNVLDAAAAAIARAREAHKRLEAFYIPAMDFGGLDRTAQRLIDEISGRNS